MYNRTFFFFSVLSAVALIAVSCSDDVGDPSAKQVSDGPTWQVIRDQILEPNCTASCHTAGARFARESDLVLTPDVAYEQLVDREPANVQAVEDGLTLVSSLGPVGVELSYLWEKINWPNEQHYEEDHPEYGSLMPLGGPPLTYGELEYIRRWIAAGAPNSGVVVDPVVLDDVGRYEPGPFVGLTAPAPEEGIQVKLGPFDIPPQTEREFFVYQPLSLEGGDFWIRRVEISMRQGSHHFIAFTLRDDIPAAAMPEPGAIRDLRDANGAIVQSTLNTMLYHRNLAGTQTPTAAWDFPPGVAVRIPAGEGLDLNSHYVNRGPQTIRGEVQMNLYKADPSEVVHEAKTLSLNNLAIELPANQVTTLERTFIMRERRHIFSLVSHAHEHNLTFGAYFVGGERDGDLIYFSDDWEHPPTIPFNPPLTIEPGQGIRAVATYNNWENRTLRFGFLSNNEMMILFGLYYTD